jgi:hypothetical protein
MPSKNFEADTKIVKQTEVTCYLLSVKNWAIALSSLHFRLHLLKSKNDV